MQRVDWNELPAAVRDAVGQHCGELRQVTPVNAGINNAVACVIDAGDGAVFVKGIPADDPRAWMYRNEVAAAGAGAPGPRQLWNIDVEGWVLIGWKHVRGRHADLAPGSPDLDLIAAALWDLDALPPLASTTILAAESHRWERMQPWRRLAADPPAQLDPWVKSHLNTFAETEYDALQILVGNHLVHTDVHPHNVLIDNQHSRAHLIDWAWARPGVAWIDAELIAFRLVAAGHTCNAANHWRLHHLPHPHLAPEIRSAFAIEMLGTWLYLSERQPSRDMLKESSAHALRWAQHLHQHRTE
ncbi:phosphotransferase [Glycomyces buryatensis]|uniref:Aminoglycoside phosphotransferase domain-containing protein n=1 Tax=Glycomyces buryatensis TaxID=2570927 RepID=A0A4S8PVS8_9ACTN|nr:phosphotransferase [Glycomyces buryatensis]THV33922.1 hypothetical protein FAB82_24405 [Glycomyces buryatensis]